jgi:uncharacterized cupin superfamily protein
MSMSTATRIDYTKVDWPEPVEIAAERVIVGAPVASTLVLEDSPTHQLGLWRISTGEFFTDHAGYTEYIHIVSGSGELIDEAGEATKLTPGTTVLMQPGWKGRWVVDDPITKVYTIVNS